MLDRPKCHIRKCKHLIGVKYIDPVAGNEEASERVVCAAYPKGIPDSIAYGDNKHLKPLPDQRNDIVYERDEEWNKEDDE